MKRQALAVLLGVFLLGVGGGVVLDRVVLYPYDFRGRQEPHANRILHRLTQELELSDAQQQDVRAILMSTRAELNTMHQHMRQRVDDILKASESRIQNILEPGQRQAFEQLMVEHRARRKHRQPFRKWHMHD